MQRIRGHHLESLAKLKGSSLDDVGRRLLSEGYVNSVDHPFVQQAYEWVKRFFDDPGQEVMIVAGERDYICEHCPISHNCIQLNPEKSPLRENVFFNSDNFRRGKDLSIIEKYGLQPGQVVRFSTLMSKLELHSSEGVRVFSEMI